MLPVCQNFGYFLMKEKHKKIQYKLGNFSCILLLLSNYILATECNITKLITTTITIIILILLYSIGSCHKSKEQRLKKITKNVDNNSEI